MSDCYFDIGDPPLFPFVAEMETTMNPYDCYISCLKMDILVPGKGFTVALSRDAGKMMCHCGLDWDKTKAEESGTKGDACTMRCTGLVANAIFFMLAF